MLEYGRAIEVGLMVLQFIPELMELHRSGNFPIERLCKVYPVEKLEMALADLKSGSVRWQRFTMAQHIE